MPGLRLGYGLCSNKAVFDKMKEVSQPWSVSIEDAFGIQIEEDFLPRTVRDVCEYIESRTT